MNTLRIVLIIIGILFVVGIYFLQKKSISKNHLQNSSSEARSLANVFFQKSMQWFYSSILSIKNTVIAVFTPRDDDLLKSQVRRRPFELLSNEQLASMNCIIANKKNDDNISSDGLNVNEQRDDTITVEPDGKGDTLLITLTVIPKPGHTFSGDDILFASKAAGLQLGEHNIFHRYALVDNKVQITPVCSLVNLFEPGYFDVENMQNFSTEGLSLFLQLPGLLMDEKRLLF